MEIRPVPNLQTAAASIDDEAAATNIRSEEDSPNLQTFIDDDDAFIDDDDAAAAGSPTDPTPARRRHSKERPSRRWRSLPSRSVARERRARRSPLPWLGSGEHVAPRSRG